MGTAWEWTWEFPGKMGIGLRFPRAGTGSCLQVCSGTAHRIFRPDTIPAIRYMMSRDPFLFAILDFIPVLDEDG